MVLFLLIWSLFCLFSFSRQDLNLTLYNFAFFNPIRTWLQALPNLQVTLIFLTLSLLLIILYLKNLYSTPGWKVLALLILPAILAYPLFSHDIFNYLFNAKMVLIYHANPHIQTAINFAFDPVVRFMHNVHTPAPYAYGWTIFSLIPGLAWLTQNFTLSFWAMKLFIAVFWLGQLYILKKIIIKLYPAQSWRWYLFALNPLVLTETLIVGHNDTVMMFFALLSYWFFLQSNKIASILFLIISASIKYATLIFFPLFSLQSLKSLQGETLKKIDLPSLSALLLLAVIFIRPDQLHSWYLIWGFSFAVLSKSRLLIKVFVALTFGALFRYAPYLYYGNWDSPVYLIRNLIWVISLVFIPLITFKDRP
ncbi:MAG: hypothetical protein V1810_04365 [Candidatus Beckwithbacteria bacterium]